MVLASGSALVTALSDSHRVPSWYPVFLGFSGIVTLICTVGMWKMTKWSVYAYACWATLGTVLAIAVLGVFNLTAVLVRVGVVAVSFYFICYRPGRPAEQARCSEPGDDISVENPTPLTPGH